MRTTEKLSELVSVMLVDTLGAFQRGAGANPGGPAQWRCLRALALLWQRRDAIARVLARDPRRQLAEPDAVMSDTGPRSSDDEAIELEAMVADATRTLLDAAQTCYQAVLPEAQPYGATSPAWPPAASACAHALRWVAERASEEPSVRRELMRVATQLLVPHYTRLCREALADQVLRAERAPRLSDVVTGGAPARPPIPVLTDDVAAHPTRDAESLLDAAQPGSWFRMYLFDQWTVARVTSRGRNGSFFMFSSRLAGRTHSLTRRSLEKMIERGQFAPLEGMAATAQS